MSLRFSTGALALLALGLTTTATFAIPQEVSASCSATQAPMCYGERAVCSISPASNVDVYQFIGVSGERIRITIAGQSANLGPRFDLYRPSGTVLPVANSFCSPCSGCVCSFARDLTLDESGMFTLTLYDSGFNNTGNYSLDLQRLPPLGPVALIDYGQSKSITIDHPSDHDWLAFDVAVGTQVLVSATGLTANLGAKLEVFDANAQVIASTSCSPCSGCVCSPAAMQIAPAIDGRYYIAISDNGNNNTGSINVSLACVLGNCPTTTAAPSIGTSYCTQTVNSTGSAAAISATGSRHIADNDVHFRVTNAPAAKLGIFFLGLNQIDTTLPNSCGRLCVQQPLVRRPIVFSCNNGVMPYQLDLTDPAVAPFIAPGQHTYFQAWFRDPTGNGSCTSTTNTSDGLDILFL